MAESMWRRRDCLQALLLAPLMFSSTLRAGSPAAQRIVAINWTAAELLLSLGITPLALSDSGYFRRRIPQLPLPATVADIGPFWEPNLELLAQLRPGLILSDALSPAVLAAMARIAPVDVVDVFPAADDAWTSLLGYLQRLALRVDRRLQAQKLVADAEQRLTHWRQQLSLRPRPAVCVAVLNQDGKHATVYGRHSLVQGVLDRLGLVNGWQGPVSRAGVTSVGIDRLAVLENSRLFTVALPTTADRLRQLRQSGELWQQLPLVRQGHVRALPPFFPFGGIHTALSLADSVARSLLSES